MKEFWVNTSIIPHCRNIPFLFFFYCMPFHLSLKVDARVFNDWKIIKTFKIIFWSRIWILGSMGRGQTRGGILPKSCKNFVNLSFIFHFQLKIAFILWRPLMLMISLLISEICCYCEYNNNNEDNNPRHVTRT